MLKLTYFRMFATCVRRMGSVKKRMNQFSQIRHQILKLRYLRLMQYAFQTSLLVTQHQQIGLMRKGIQGLKMGVAYRKLRLQLRSIASSHCDAYKMRRSFKILTQFGLKRKNNQQLIEWQALRRDHLTMNLVLSALKSQVSKSKTLNRNLDNV